MRTMGPVEQLVLVMHVAGILGCMKFGFLESIEINCTQALSSIGAEAASRPWALYLIITISGGSQPYILGRAFASGSWDRLRCKVQAFFYLSFWQATASTKAGTSIPCECLAQT